LIRDRRFVKAEPFCDIDPADARILPDRSDYARRCVRPHRIPARHNAPSRELNFSPFLGVQQPSWLIDYFNQA
jgi:hypothetical protein